MNKKKITTILSTLGLALSICATSKAVLVNEFNSETQKNLQTALNGQELSVASIPIDGSQNTIFFNGIYGTNVYTLRVLGMCDTNCWANILNYILSTYSQSIVQNGIINQKKSFFLISCDNENSYKSLEEIFKNNEENSFNHPYYQNIYFARYDRAQTSIEKAKEEAERIARENAERIARENAERIARENAERIARENAERMAREEAERMAREEAERMARKKIETANLENTEYTFIPVSGILKISYKGDCGKITEESVDYGFGLTKEDYDLFKKHSEESHPCHDIKTVIIEGNIDNIGENAFYQFNNLETLIISKNLQKIDNEAFDRCCKLKNIRIIDGTDCDINNLKKLFVRVRKDVSSISSKEVEKIKKEAERIDREEAERMARENAERVDREEAERIDREEAERIDREEAERIASEKAERIARKKAERMARKKAERMASEKAERIASEKAATERKELEERIKKENKEQTDNWKAQVEKNRIAKEEAKRKKQIEESQKDIEKEKKKQEKELKHKK